MDQTTSDSRNPEATKGSGPFIGLSEREVAALYKTAPIKQLQQGECLIREGDTDQNFYIILDGLITISKAFRGQVLEITTLRDGDWVGEIAFTKNIPRTASAFAKIPASVMVMDEATLETLDHQTQLYFYKRLNDLAAVRVADLSAREDELSSKNQQLMEYILASHDREKVDYQSSDMIRSFISKVPRISKFASFLALKALDEKFSLAEAAEDVKESPSLSSLVLKIANSPFYSLKTNLTDIHHALLQLGFNEVYQLVLGEGIRRAMPDNPEFRIIHAHSNIIAHLAFVISQESRIGRPLDAATVGLLHSLGRCALQLLKEKNPQMSTLIDALDSAHIGAMLLKEWHLPEKIYRAVEYQSTPEYCSPSMVPEDVLDNVACLYLAHLTGELLKGVPPEELPTVFIAEYLSHLNWNDLTLMGVLETRLMPAYIKKLATYPQGVRRLLARGQETIKTRSSAAE